MKFIMPDTALRRWVLLIYITYLYYNYYYRRIQTCCKLLFRENRRYSVITVILRLYIEQQKCIGGTFSTNRFALVLSALALNNRTAVFWDRMSILGVR